MDVVVCKQNSIRKAMSESLSLIRGKQRSGVNENYTRYIIVPDDSIGNYF